MPLKAKGMKTAWVDEHLPSRLLGVFIFFYYHQTLDDCIILHMTPWAEEKVLKNIDDVLEINDHSYN